MRDRPVASRTWVRLALAAALAAGTVHAQFVMRATDTGRTNVVLDAAGQAVSWERGFVLAGGGAVSYRVNCTVDRQGWTRIAILNGGWYANGSLTVLANGKPVALRNAADPVLRADEAGAVLEWRWETTNAGPLRLRLLARPGDDKLFGELARTGPAAPEVRLGLELLAFPGHLGGEPGAPACDRWFSTGARAVRHGVQADVLELARENWALLYDANRNSAGTCALLFLPEQCESAGIDQRANRAVTTVLTGRAGQSALRLLLWSFPFGYKTPDAAHAYLAAHAAEWTRELRGVEFERRLPAQPEVKP